MLEIRETGNCGIDELKGISGQYPEDLLEEMLNDHYGADGDNPPFITFSDVVRANAPNGVGGVGLAAYITRKKLGKVVRVGPAAGLKNPNSGNNIVMWVWTPNWKKVFKSIPCSRCGR